MGEKKSVTFTVEKQIYFPETENIFFKKRQLIEGFSVTWEKVILESKE